MKRILAISALVLLWASSFAQQVDINRLKEHIYLLASDSLMGRGFGTSGGRMAAEYIEKQFKEAGLKPWNGKYNHPFISNGFMVKTEGANIIGWVEGTDKSLKREFIVLGAHYDHLAYRVEGSDTVVYNGADDNASGVASIIEIGRWLARNSSLLKRSVILVAFDGEEAGLLGSSHIVKKEVLPIDKVKFMFSLDMVGMLKKYGGIDLVGNRTLKGGDELFSQLASEHGIEIKKTGGNIEVQTDTQPFGNAGVPAVHVFTSTVSPYHKPTDDADRLDYEGMAKISSFVANATAELANMESLEPGKKFENQVKRKNKVVTGFVFGFGNAYHYYRDEFYQSKPGFAFDVGLYSKFRLTNSLDFQLKAMYLKYSTEHAYGKFRSHELFVPASLLYYFSERSSYGLIPDLYLIVGANYVYRFAGKVGDGSFSIDNFRNNIYGMHFGFGLSSSKINIQMVRYMMMKSIDHAADIYPNPFIFSIGYNF